MDLILPVYLNQRIVFDMVAMLEGGISTITQVSHRIAAGERVTGEVSGKFGLADAFASLLRVNFSGAVARGAESRAQLEKGEERIHTPASLLQRMRAELLERNIVKPFSPELPPTPGEIIEVESFLSRNPVVRALSLYSGLLDIAIALSDDGRLGGKQQVGKRRISQEEMVKRQIDHLIQKLIAGGSIDIIADDIGAGFRAVITLEEQFLNDPTMSDLVDGRFRVIGKVIRTIEDSSSSISLLRKTALSAVGTAALEELFGSLQEVKQAPEIRIPKIEWEISGPVMHLLPIAIFS